MGMVRLNLWTGMVPLGKGRCTVFLALRNTANSGNGMSEHSTLLCEDNEANFLKSQSHLKYVVQYIVWLTRRVQKKEA